MMTLENLGKGAAKELFEAALAKVIENIKDPNTDWKKQRAIVLTVTFNANEERNEVAMTISAPPKLAPQKPFALKALVGIHSTGQTEAREFEVPMFPTVKADDGKVMSINKAQEGK